nr:DUF2971 domain-containing protein [Reichenbachiella agariperforans]
MWNEYGSDHKGACLKLKIHKTRGIPPTYQLGNIIYHNKKTPIIDLENLYKRHLKFKEEHGYSITNIDEILYLVSSYYKQDCFVKEQEIRLVKTLSGTSLPFRNSPEEPPLEYAYISEEGCFRYFMELPLNKATNSIIAPHITIEEIIFGKHISDQEFYTLSEITAEQYKNSFQSEPMISIIRGD